VAVYPPEIIRAIESRANVGVTGEGSTRATNASFVCGSYVELSLAIAEADRIQSVKFRSNGCGYMVAASNALCDWLKEKLLSDLHGLNEDELMSIAASEIGEFPEPRVQCAAVVFDALRRAMASYRARRVEEFQGEKALICTCFGVSEESIVSAIEQHSLTDVEEVVEICRAGSGCGSCRMLIQELIDGQDDQYFNAEIAETAEET